MLASEHGYLNFKNQNLLHDRPGKMINIHHQAQPHTSLQHCKLYCEQNYLEQKLLIGFSPYVVRKDHSLIPYLLDCWNSCSTIQGTVLSLNTDWEQEMRLFLQNSLKWAYALASKSDREWAPASPKNPQRRSRFLGSNTNYKHDHQLVRHVAGVRDITVPFQNFHHTHINETQQHTYQCLFVHLCPT